LFHGALLTVSTLVVNVDTVNITFANPALRSGVPRIEIPTSVGRISLSVEGTAERAVFLWPSLFSDLHLYDLVIPLLGPDWRIIRVDGPGFGASERPQPNTQPEQYAEAVPELLDALGQERTIFAGTSWGGQIGAHLACRHADKVEALLLMNTPLEPAMGGHLTKLFLTRWFVRRTFFAKAVARTFFSPTTLKDAPGAVRAFTARFSGFEGRAAATTVATTLRAFPGLEGILPRISVPATVLCGEQDRLYSLEALGRTARKIPNAKIEVLPACGHLAPLEAPQAVARAITDLADRVSK
jgi:pimeloyl-ACP methyl ester carboxylesterase